jgi:GNAT superfamily N-acetyltransferase
VDQVERLMVEGLPLPALAPWRSGVLFPPDPSAIPGWIMWLAERGGTPMGCCATFDDGSSVGLYGMAVDLGMRRQGVGRALIDAMVARYPALPSCLTATEEGFWLYASAGYHTVGLSAWWRRGGRG